MRIDELVAHRPKSMPKPSYTDIGRAVLRGERTKRNADGKKKPIKDKVKGKRIGEWNRGTAITGVRLRHLRRLADYFNVHDIRQLIEVVEADK